MLESKLLAGGTGYDLVFPSDNFLSRQIQAGVFAKLDKSKLPNWKNLDPEMMERAARFDPGNAYAGIYLWAATGFGYNEQMIKERMPDAPVDSWRMIFDPELARHFADCGIYMLDAPDEMVPAALNYIGENPDSKDRNVNRKSGNGPGGGTALHPQVPLLGVHQRPGQRRHLPGGDVVGRCRYGHHPRQGGGKADRSPLR